MWERERRLFQGPELMGREALLLRLGASVGMLTNSLYVCTSVLGMRELLGYEHTYH